MHYWVLGCGSRCDDVVRDSICQLLSLLGSGWRDFLIGMIHTHIVSVFSNCSLLSQCGSRLALAGILDRSCTSHHGRSQRKPQMMRFYLGVWKLVCCVLGLEASITCDHKRRLAPSGLGPDEAPLMLKSVGERNGRKCKRAESRNLIPPLRGFPPSIYRQKQAV